MNYKKVCKSCNCEYEVSSSNPNHKRQKYCVDCGPKQWSRGVHTYICLNCKINYPAKQKIRDKFCSRECAFEYRRKNTKPEKEIVKRITTCAICGISFNDESKTKRGKYCSDKCRKEQNRRNSYRYFISEAKPINCVCVICGTQFLSKTAAGSKYCSKRCQRKDWLNNTPLGRATRRRQASRRRARLRGAKVEHFTEEEIYKRDGYVCQICKKPVAMNESVPHHRAPTLDHIIPLSLGGNHTRDNVRLTHFICNSKRGNREPAQMILFG